jgi:hypothetical protein
MYVVGSWRVTKGRLRVPYSSGMDSYNWFHSLLRAYGTILRTVQPTTYTYGGILQIYDLFQKIYVVPKQTEFVCYLERYYTARFFIFAIFFLQYVQSKQIQYLLAFLKQDIYKYKAV